MKNALSMQPYISILLPTLNSARTLSLCLNSLAAQNYPKEKLEIVFADGGSVDMTRWLIEKFRKDNPLARIVVLDNPLKTGEAGKAVALKAATGDIYAFIDSDNILEGVDWLRRMVDAFENEQVVATEPIRYTYRRGDGPITRYCALMGMNDPLCYYLGNYDRECVLSGRWTEMPYDVIKETPHFKILRLDPSRLPTIGANGFLARRSLFEEAPVGDYLFDIDVLASALKDDPDKYVAKVSVGIVHLFSSDLTGFWRKQLRRVADYRHFKSKNLRTYQWGHMNKAGLLYFIASCVLVVPLLIAAVRGYWARKDLCWIYHPIMCVMTCAAYAFGFLKKSALLDRGSWQARGVS